MSKRKILVLGPMKRLRRLVISLLKDLSGVCTVERDSFERISSFFSEHRIDAVFLESCTDFIDTLQLIHHENPTLPVITYSDSPDYKSTRMAFHSGAKDVLSLHNVTTDQICAMLERALDPLRRGSANESQHQAQSIEIIAQRGRFLEQRLLAGDPPPFYMNGNRATLLRADILPIQDDIMWRQNAAWEWVQEFGINNSFMFSSTSGELRMGAIVEQDFVNLASFKRMLHIKLERCFTRLSEINCVCAASYCSSDYMSLSVLHHLDHLAELVFYLDTSQLIPEDQPRNNMPFPNELYTEFCSAAAMRDVHAASQCVIQATEKLRTHMPSPSIAKASLNRFLWDFITLAGTSCDLRISLKVDDSRISSLRDAILNIIQAVLSKEREADLISPLDDLIQKIESNPGLPINIDQAAQEINFSRSHFCRLFRQRTGLSFTAFVTQKRIALACNLLKTTGLRVEEIANVVGINNTWYFKKLFEKEMGQPIESWAKDHNHNSEIWA